MTSAVIYTRFSPRRNADESESCENQEALCRELADARGWAVRGVYRDEGLSGDDPDRPGLADAIAALHRGDALLVYRHDRLARSPLLAELIRRQVGAAKAKIVAVEGDVAGDDDSPEATFIRRVLDAVAALERELIGARTSRALRVQQRGGKRVGRYAPYGYAIDPADETRLVPDAREEAAVERIKALAAEGLSAGAIVRKLNEDMRGLARGKTGWSKRTVGKIVGRA